MRGIFALFVVSLVILCWGLSGCGTSDEDFTLPTPHPVVTPEETDEVDGNEVVTDEEAENVEISDIFWISESGVLHNSLCRWYRICSGAEWDGAAEHTNCQTCGGDHPIIRRWNLESNQNK